MSDWFLERGKAKLEIAKLLGFLDRWIRQRLREMPDGDLWVVRREFHRDCKRLASLDSPTKNPSMGARYRAWQNHPLRPFLDAEDNYRAGPLLTLFDDLSKEEMDGYIEWRRNKNPDDVDKLKVEELLALWRREGRRVLPVLPRPGSLPSNANVRRSLNHREGGGRPGDSLKATEEKEKASTDRKTEGEVSLSEQGREVH